MTDESKLPVLAGEYTVVKPLVSPEQAVEQWEMYQALIGKILRPEDYQTFTEDGKERKFKKKSAWRKLGTFYGVSVRVTDERIFHRHDVEKCLRARFPDKFGDVADCGCPVVGARYTVEATAPNGRIMPGVGLATYNEKNARYTRVEHDIAAKAFTRAVNRAISDLIGAGEDSAEERRGDENAKTVLSKEERLALKDAWDSASGVLQNDAILAMGRAGAKGSTVKQVYISFLNTATEDDYREVMAILTGNPIVDFDPDEVPSG